MNRSFLKKWTCFVLVLLMVTAMVPALIFSSSAAEASVTLSFAGGSGTNQDPISFSDEASGVSAAFTAGTHSTKPRWDANCVRFYGTASVTNNLTVSAPAGATITKIAFAMNGSYQLTTVSANSGTIDTSTNTWTGSANSVVFTTTAQTRIEGATITCTIPDAAHEHAYSWDGNVGADGSHILNCANTDGKCDALTITEECTWVNGNCSVCGVAAPECAHPTTTEVAEVPATCTEGGYTAGVRCTVCNQYTSGHEEISALGHNLVTDAAVDATCTETGLTEGKHCDRAGCGYVETAQEVVDALGHNYVNGVCSFCDKVKPSVANTNVKYTFSDYPAGTQYASNEEHVLDDYLTIYTTDAHFTSELRIYSSSSNNGYAIIKSTDFIDSIILNAGNKADTLNVYTSTDGDTWILAEGVATYASYKDYTVKFDNDTKYIKLDVAGTNQVRIKYITVHYACAHTNTEAIGEAKAATCTEDGITAGEKCSDCDKILEEQETIPATGHIDENPADSKCDTCGETLCTEHIWIDGEVITEGDCTTDRVVAQVCENCGEPGEDKIITAPGHTSEVVPGKAATCTETGLTDGAKCSVCNEQLTAQEEFPMIDHNYVNYTCSSCGMTIPFKLGDIVIFTGSKADGSDTQELTGFESGAKYGTSAVYTDTPANLFLITVVEGYKSGTFAFKNGENYIACLGEKNVNLSATLNASTSWKVTTNADGELEIISCDNSIYYLQYNSGSPRFTTYKNGSQQPIKIVNLSPSIQSVSLTLNKGVKVNVKYNISELWLALNTGAKVVFDNGQEFDAVAGENVYSVQLTPGQIADALKVGINEATVEASVAKYTEKVKAATAATMNLTEAKYNALVALLDKIAAYGAAANEAGSNLTDEFQGVGTHTKNDDYGIFGEVSATLDEQASLAFEIKNSNTDFNLNDATVVVTLGGKTIASGTLPSNKLVINGLRPVNFNDELVITITASDAKVASITLTFNQYLKELYGTETNDKIKNMAVAAYQYGVAAENYGAKQ